jgi:hypothetical protein
LLRTGIGERPPPENLASGRVGEGTKDRDVGRKMNLFEMAAKLIGESWVDSLLRTGFQIVIWKTRELREGFCGIKE